MNHARSLFTAAVIIAVVGVLFAAVRGPDGEASRAAQKATSADVVPRYAGPDLFGGTTVPTTEITQDSACSDPANSYDSACGPFQWIGGQPANAPARIISVAFDPPVPTAGQTVVVTATMEDADALDATITISVPGCTLCPGKLPRTDRCREPYGPWDVPSPPANPYVEASSWDVVWGAPGTYTYAIYAQTRGPVPAPWYADAPCSPHPLYDSTVTARGDLVVAPAPEGPPAVPEPTSTPDTTIIPDDGFDP